VAALSVVIAVISAFRETRMPAVQRMRELKRERRARAFRENTAKRSRANLPLNLANPQNTPWYSRRMISSATRFASIPISRSMPVGETINPQ
jgi:hypothetical protein